MNFSRAKTILICIFIFVNVFLLVVYNLFFQTDKTISTKTISQILANNNIKVEESIIKNFGKTVNGVEIENLATNEKTLATLFLGKNFNNSKTHYYTKEGESLTVSNMTVDYKVVEPHERGYRDVTQFNAGNKALKSLVKKGFSKEVLTVSNVSDNGNNTFFITFSYKFEDHPVFNNNLYATVTGKGISNIKGTVIFFKKLKDIEYDVTPASNILMELPLNNDLKTEFKNPAVTGIKLGYFLPMGKTEASIYAIPAYEIEINSKKVYYYDARENISSDIILLGSKNIMK